MVHSDCCVMSFLEWGHARIWRKMSNNSVTGSIWPFLVGLSLMSTSCLLADHNIYNLEKNYNDSPAPLLVLHLNPSGLTWNEAQPTRVQKPRRKGLMPGTKKQKENRKHGWPGGYSYGGASSSASRRPWGYYGWVQWGLNKTYILGWKENAKLTNWWRCVHFFEKKITQKAVFDEKYKKTSEEKMIPSFTCVTKV